MREIKFRGRLVTADGPGRWIYGTFAKHNGNFVIFAADTGERFIIDPTTLGQYIGAKDAYGIEIYEGDLLRLIGEKNPLLYECRWNSETCAFDYFNKSGPVFNPATSEFMLVVANIYQNPDLINEGD